MHVHLLLAVGAPAPAMGEVYASARLLETGGELDLLEEPLDSDRRRGNATSGWFARCISDALRMVADGRWWLLGTPPDALWTRPDVPG
jgi:hypothetical protein